MAVNLLDVESVVVLAGGHTRFVGPSTRQVRISFKDGARYIGEALVGEHAALLEVSGSGEYTHGDGEVSVGQFVKGELQGRGTQTSLNGDMFNGTFVKGMKEGKGEVHQADGTTLHGIWKNGKLQGPATRLHPGGVVEKSYWKSGVRDPFSSSLTIPKSARPTIVLIEPQSYVNTLVSWTLTSNWDFQRMNVLETAYHRLGPEKDQTPMQAQIREMLLSGTLPRSLVARLQRKLLEEENGKGLLVDFPLDVEEARMIKSWGFHVSACIVLHVDAVSLATTQWLDKNPIGPAKDIPLKLEDIKKCEEAVSAYEEEIAPLIKYYEDVYIPIRVSPRNGYKAELLKRLGL